MWHLFQPLFAMLIGVAVSIFALWNTFSRWPAASAWRQVVAAAPALLEVVLVVACATLAVAGIAMLTTGVRTARQRFAHLRRLHLAPHPEHYGEPPEHWE